MNGETVKYQLNEENSISKITVPIVLAKGLNWKDKDQIGVKNETIEGQAGLFIWKRE